LRIALGLAGDVAHDPAEIGLECSQGLARPFELLGVGIALMLDQRDLAKPGIGLAQFDAELACQTNQPLERAMHQAGVGRMGDRLRLHGGVDNRLGEIGGLGRIRADRRCQAFLQQRIELLLAHPLPPAGHRRAIEGQFMAEELLAAEQLIVGVLHPALAQGLVRQIVHRLEDGKSRHQPGRQRWMARRVSIDCTAARLHKAPVDCPAEPGQRMIHINDLIQPRPEKIVLTAVPPFLRTHSNAP